MTQFVLYLAAFDHSRGEPAPDGLDAAAFVARSLARVPWAHAVEVHVPGATVAGLLERFPPGLAELDAEPGGVRLRMRAEGLGWVAGLLAGLRQPFVVREPAALRDELGARELDGGESGSRSAGRASAPTVGAHCELQHRASRAVNVTRGGRRAASATLTASSAVNVTRGGRRAGGVTLTAPSAENVTRRVRAAARVTLAAPANRFRGSAAAPV